MRVIWFQRLAQQCGLALQKLRTSCGGGHGPVALITWFIIRDLLDTRRRELRIYNVYVPPLFSLLAPTGCDYIPYLFLQPSAVPRTGWPIAGHNVEDDDTIPVIPVR